MVRLFPLLAALGTVLTLQGQDYRVMEYDPPALNEGVALCGITTPDGWMWFGQFGALVAYDGSEYRYFTYDPNDSTSVTYGNFYQLGYHPDGHILAGSDIGGLTRFERSTGKSTTWHSDPLNEATIGGERVSGLTVDRRLNIWVATDNFCLSRIDTSGHITRFHPPLPETATDFLDAGPLQEVIEDINHPGIFWVNSKFGLYRFTEANGVFEFIKTKRNGVEVAQGFEEIVQDRSGRVWMTARNEGIWSYNPVTREWQTFKAIEGPEEARGTNFLHELICTRDNRIIGASSEEGLWIIDPAKDSLALYMVPHEDLFHYFRSLLVLVEDSQGDLWTGRMKLIRLTERETSFRFFSFGPYVPPKEQGNWQREYIDDHTTGNFFIGTWTGDGLLHANIRTGLVSYYRYKSEAESTYDVSMEELVLAGDSGVWIGSDSGLLYHDRATRSISRVRPTDRDLAEFMEDMIRCILVEKEGTLLLAAERKGLVRWDPRTGYWKQFLTDVPARAGKLREVRQSTQGVWWLAFERDLALLNPNTQELVFVPHRSHGAAGLNAAVINDLELDQRGDAWITTTGGGINHVTYANRKFSFRYYTSADGMPSDFTSELVFAQDGHLWVGTRSGLAVIDTAADVIISYSARDGLNFNARGGPLYQLATGHILSGGRGGFHLAHVDSVDRSSQAPRPYLYQVETASASHMLAFTGDIRISIGPADNYFTVTWGAVAFDETPTIRYAYQLEGFDDGWILAGERKFARYSKLPGGNYTFRLKAVNARGQWSEELAALRVHVTPPFTKTIWFYVLIGSLVAAVLYAFYRVRMRMIRREAELTMKFERELAQVEMQALRAQMNPHFLFNSLNSINRFIVKNDSKAASKYLTRFSRLIRLILDNSKSNKVTLANELEAIRLYVELESLRFDDRFTFDMHVDENVEPDNIEIDSLILQPYIENAIWHGLMHKDGHGTLRMAISRNHTTLKCVIEDDGIGRLRAAELKSKTAVKDKSYGMKITSDRLKMLNKENRASASVQVTDLVAPDGSPAGTRVEITLPC